MPINLLYAKDESAENLVATNIKEINERNWPDIPTLWCKSQRNVMKQFFNEILKFNK